MSNTRAKCPRCDEGWIPCSYFHSPGAYGTIPEYCYPSESENEVMACEECGANDWTDAELEVIDEQAAQNYEPRDPEDYLNDDEGDVAP